MSTAISSIQYDDKTQVLTVGFVEGGSYTYSPVSPETVEAFRNAGSQGQFFNEAIRPMAPGSRNWSRKRSVSAKMGWAKKRAKGDYWSR